MLDHAELLLCLCVPPSPPSAPIHCHALIIRLFPHLALRRRWQARYSELKTAHDAAVLAAAEASGRAEASIAELRSESRLKAFECERMRLQCEEALGAAREARVDAECLREKVEVLKSEYYALKTSTASMAAKLEAGNATLSERVRTYESLEEELDRTVLQSGALLALTEPQPSGNEATAGGAPSSGGGGGGALQPFLRVPSSAQRRMQQCLGLARDLLREKRRAEVAEGALTEAKAEEERLAASMRELQHRLRQASQPQAYLADQLDAADAKRVTAEGRCEALHQELARRSDELVHARQQNEALLADLETLLSQRGSLEALRTTLTRMLPAELAPVLAPPSASGAHATHK